MTKLLYGTALAMAKVILPDIISENKQNPKEKRHQDCLLKNRFAGNKYVGENEQAESSWLECW
jgi:hypothetical protein